MKKSPMRRLAAWLCALSLAFAPTAPAFAQDSGEGVLLDLRGVDLLALVKLVSRRAEKNFIIDPRVRGNVTVISSKPLPDSALYELFLSILAVNGFTVVEGDHAAKIVPFTLGKAIADRGTDELESRIVSLTHADPAAIVNAVRPFVAEQGYLAQLQGGIFISDTLANVDRVEAFIREIDRPRESEYEIVPILHNEAQSISDLLNAHTQKAGIAASISVDKNGNRLLISGDAESRRLLGELATALDTPIESSANVRVIRLKFADAVELVDVLRELAQDFRLPGGERETTTTTTPVAAEPAPAPEGGESQPSPDPGQIVEETETTSYEESTVGIQAYESLNAVILSGPAALTSAMASIVKELDQRRSQVLIEAIVAEISSNDEDSFGSGLLAWSRSFGALGSNFTGGDLVDGDLISANALAGTVNVLNAVVAGAGIGSINNGGLAVGLGDKKFAALINLVKSQGNSRVVSTPSIMTLDNEEASIIIGDNVSVQTGVTGTGTDQRETYERRDVGLSLKIKPQINADNIIRLRIEQELSTEPTGVGLALEYRKRTINTSVLVGDGNIIVLGGLAEREQEENSSKVPFLGDLPVVGRLFSNESRTGDTSNLVIFLRPTVISSEEVSRELSQQLYEEILRQEAGESIIESLDIHEALVGDEANEVDESDAAPNSESDAAPVFESDAAPASESESTPE